MSTTALSTLTARLADDIPARWSIPSTDQYQRAVIDSVMDFSRRCGRVKITTLSIVNGTASYALPTDFTALVRLSGLTVTDGIINAGSLIPVLPGYKERYVIADGVITFYPTPSYTLSRDLIYKAGWVMDSDDEYDEMGDAESGVILLLAAAKCLGWQAAKAAQEAWSYQIGDERASKEKLADSLSARSAELRAQYHEEVKIYAGRGGQGTLTQRASYDLGAYE